MICKITKFTALLFALMIVAFFIGEGFPSISSLSAEEIVLFFDFIVIWIGLLIGLRWEIWGGLMVILGVVVFYLVMYLFSHQVPRGAILLLFGLAGMGLVYCGHFSRKPPLE
ncbi:MAG: hypothetical protein B6D59_05845 [Campylobacteraceae bacterium 4484_4]|nr:MAG: hypothetical protein B6D59_05845 [Campylobacteraceae bacterium 4484_4]